MPRLALLTRYDDLGASSRVRLADYVPPLSGLLPNWSVSRHSLLGSRYLHRKFAGQSTLTDVMSSYVARMRELPRADLWWLEKEMWPWAPAWLERIALTRQPFVLDLDDAIFHNYDLHRSRAVRLLFGQKIDRLMAASTLVTAGNDYLADRARAAGAPWVEVVPTVIDLTRYPRPDPAMRRSSDGTVRVAWIGSPTTARYLQALAPALRGLSREHRIQLVAIGAGKLDMPGVDVNLVAWSADTEVGLLSACDVGVMPLADSPWERGKCGFKLIQYMACGLPVVASPVGANRHIVDDGGDGFLAHDDASWHLALDKLCRDATLRATLGAAGRRKVEQSYCYQVTAPRLAHWFERIVGRRS